MLKSETYNEIEYLDIRKLLICTIIGLLNSFCYGNKAIMGGLCAFEVAFLLFFLLRNDYVRYVCYYLVFLSFSMESETFVGTNVFYGFKNFRFAGINLAVWMLIPIMVLLLVNLKVFRVKPSKKLRIFIRKLLIFTVIGCIMGLLSYLANDNGAGSFSTLFDCYYSNVLPFIEIMIVSWSLIINRDKLFIAKQFLYAEIPALAIVFTICMITGNYGNRGGLQSLQVSELYFLLVCALILVIYDQFSSIDKTVLMISGAVILILSLMYNSSGKIVIMTVMIPIAMIILMKRKGSATKTIVAVISAVVALMLIFSWLFPLLMAKSQLLTYKYQQAISMFSFGTGIGNWLQNMPESPRMRITEFINIGAEFLKKPWFALFGKGFGGTIKDNLNLFTDLNSFMFSEWELSLGAYYSMHESINCFFLIGGLYGLFTLFSLLGIMYKNFHKSPWLLMGLLWFLFFYNYHMNIAIYGICSIIVGFLDIENKKDTLLR